MQNQETANSVEKSPLESTGETLANSVYQQATPIEEPKNEMFVSEPFFKEEPKVEGEEGKPVETEQTIESAELNADGTPKTPVAETITSEASVATEPAQIEEEEFVSLLNNAIGDTEVSFSSIDEIKAVIEENKKFKSAQNELQQLSQEERARIEVGRESGDFGLYDRVMGIDTSKITHKEALKQAYFLDNRGKSAQYLEKAFEKEFTRTYEDETDEEFSKIMLQDNGQEAINRIIDLQEDLKKRGQISGSANPEEAKKAKIEEDNKWFADVDKVLESKDRVTYTYEDKLAIHVVMDAKDKPTIQEAMDKPIDFIKSLITDEDGKYDHEALFEFILYNFYKEETLNEARKSGAAFREEKILKEKKNTVIESGKAGDPGAETPIREQIASNLSKLINY